MYIALFFIVFLSIDVWKALWFTNDQGVAEFGIGVGTLVLALNTVLLGGYTLGCHSCRNIVGGRLNHFSKHPLRYKAWGLVGKLNARHMLFAWVTLGSLVVTDAYIALVSSGAFGDLRIIN